MTFSQEKAVLQLISGCHPPSASYMGDQYNREKANKNCKEVQLGMPYKGVISQTALFKLQSAQWSADSETPSN